MRARCRASVPLRPAHGRPRAVPDSARRTSSSVRLRDRPATGETPAARAIDSWPTSVSTHPRLPHAHSGAVRVDGDVTELAAEAVRAAEQATTEHDAAARRRPRRRRRRSRRSRRRRPSSALRARRGSTRSRRGREAEPLLELGCDGQVLPAQVRGEHDGARRLLDEPRDGDRDADRAAGRHGRRPRAPPGPRVPAGRARAPAPSLGCRGTSGARSGRRRSGPRRRPRRSRR